MSNLLAFGHAASLGTHCSHRPTSVYEECKTCREPDSPSPHAACHARASGDSLGRGGLVFTFLSRLLRGVRRSPSWVLPTFVIAFVFATSWPLMALAEPVGSKILEPA